MRKIFNPTVLLICLLAVGSLSGVGKIIAAPVSANIVINNRPYMPQNAIENINSRMLLPFREISEAIGATVDWDPSSRRILTTYGNKYSIMFIDNAIVTYGTYSITSAGEMQFSSARTSIMDVVPQLVGNSTYIPLRAFAETIGAEVEWIGGNSTAYINVSQAEEPTTAGPTPTPTPSTTPTPSQSNYNDFSNTSYFRLMAADAVKSMYQDSNNRPFAFVLYNSNEESSKRIVPNLQDVAQSISLRIYGVDMADRNNNSDDNKWLWSFFRENAFQDPTLYLVYSKDDVKQYPAPSDMAEVKSLLTRFAAQSETEYEYGDFSDTTYFKTKSDIFIAEETLDNREFIVVLYDSTDEDSKFYIPFIKAAAKEKKQLVYGVNIDKYPRFYRNIDFMEDYQLDATGNLPIMFLVYKDEDDIQAYNQPSTVDRAKSYIDEFLNNKGSGTTHATYSDIRSGAYYSNANINDLKTKFNSSEKFVIFVYDSSDESYKSLVENFTSRSENESTLRGSFLYGINKSSTSYDENHVESNYSWLRMGSGYMTSTRPFMICINSGNITGPEYVTSYSNALSLLRDYINLCY